MSQIVGVKTKDIADVGKRKKPVVMIGQEPILSVAGNVFGARVFGDVEALKGVNGAFQHGKHEELFRLEVEIGMDVVRILVARQNIRLEAER